MALRNISNIQQLQQQANQANIKQNFMYTLNTNNENNNFNKIQLQNPNGSSSISTSSGGSGGSSIQIRTSSPISSSSSGSEISGPANAVISPSKFMKAVHLSRKQQQKQKITQCLQHPPSIQNYVSMKELAFDKLRKQKSIENDLKQAFPNLNELNNQNEKLKSLGKLKISIYNNMNHLTINIMEGRSFKINNSVANILDTYVKITMLPDMDKRFKKCQTNPIKPHVYEKSSGKEIFNYKYDSKYSFELDNVNDLRNRLIISVWCIVPGQQKHQTVGLFSFKIKHLMKQVHPKSIWYHLLPLKYGLTKNLKCSSKSSLTSLNNINNNEVKCVPNVNKDIIGMEKLSLTLIKQNENEGFGFTLTGSCPCMVGKVDNDKTAFKCGLRNGDYISKINNKNVSRATCESVVKLIKSCKFRLDLQVYRQNQPKSTKPNFDYPKMYNKNYQQMIPIQNYYQYNQNLTSSTTSGGSFSSISTLSTSEYEPQNEILVPIPQLQSQPPSQTNLINNYQNNLEVVLEEDENELEDDDEEINDLKNDSDSDEDVIRHVDSFSSDLNTSNEQLHSSNNANALRRVAAQYIHRQHHANIMSLRSLKFNNE